MWGLLSYLCFTVCLCVCDCVRQAWFGQMVWPTLTSLLSAYALNFNVIPFPTNPSASSLLVWFTEIVHLHFISPGPPAMWVCFSVLVTANRIISLVSSAVSPYNKIRYITNIQVGYRRLFWSMWAFLLVKKKHDYRKSWTHCNSTIFSQPLP